MSIIRQRCYVFSHSDRPLAAMAEEGASGSQRLAGSGPATPASQKGSRGLSAELLLCLLSGRLVSGPSGQEDSDNKAL